MEIKLTSAEITLVEADGLILPLFTEGAPYAAQTALDSILGGVISAMVNAKEIKAKAGEMTLIYTLGKLKQISKVAVVGLGKKTDFTADKLRQAVAEAARGLQKKGCKRLAVVLPELSLSPDETGEALAMAVRLGSYTFRRHITKEADYGDIEELVIVADNKLAVQIKTGADRGNRIAGFVTIARDMANEPSNHMTPADMAAVAQKLAKENGLEIKVLERADMAKLGMDSLLGVAQGSERAPRLVVLKYHGRPVNTYDLAIVGKGLTFDSGGVSIKPADKMEDMKFDMSGGAAAIAAMAAIASLKLPLNVMGVIPCVENMPDGAAYKPGDVLKTMNGKTIEVISTDAEGRLILADAITYALREKPAALIDMATLTGACVIALGKVASAGFTNNAAFFAQVMQASVLSGEKIWPMPTFDEYREQYKSDVADMKNVGGREAGASTGALIISEFVGDTPWVHLDIAGTAYTDKEKGHITKGGTGIPVATLVKLAQILSATG